MRIGGSGPVAVVAKAGRPCDAVPGALPRERLGAGAGAASQRCAQLGIEDELPEEVGQRLGILAREESAGSLEQLGGAPVALPITACPLARPSSVVSPSGSSHRDGVTWMSLWASASAISFLGRCPSRITSTPSPTRSATSESTLRLNGLASENPQFVSPTSWSRNSVTPRRASSRQALTKVSAPFSTASRPR